MWNNQNYWPPSLLQESPYSSSRFCGKIIQKHSYNWAKIQKEHLQLHYAIAARLLMIIIANENKRSFQLLWHSPKSTAGLPTEKSEMVCCFKNCPDQLFDIVIEKNFENEAKLTIYKIFKSLEWFICTVKGQNNSQKKITFSNFHRRFQIYIFDIGL